MGSPLPTPAYVMVFPIIRAVLSWPIPSPLHEPALSALALHVSPRHLPPQDFHAGTPVPGSGDDACIQVITTAYPSHPSLLGHLVQKSIRSRHDFQGVR